MKKEGSTYLRSYWRQMNVSEGRVGFFSSVVCGGLWAGHLPIECALHARLYRQHLLDLVG